MPLSPGSPVNLLPGLSPTPGAEVQLYQSQTNESALSIPSRSLLKESMVLAIRLISWAELALIWSEDFLDGKLHLP